MHIFSENKETQCKATKAEDILEEGISTREKKHHANKMGILTDLGTPGYTLESRS